MSVNTSYKTVDVAVLSADIIDLSSKIGKMEGGAEAAHFLPSPVARRVDAGEIKLNDFLDDRQTLRGMRVDLDRMYRHFLVISADCSSIQNGEIRTIFETQIKSLHEKRAVLELGLRGFDNLLKAHCDLAGASDEIENEAEAIESYTKGELEIDKAPDIVQHLSQLRARVNFIPPLFEGGGDEYCQTHFERKQELIRDIYELNIIISLKEKSRRKEIKNCIAQILQDLTSLQEKKLEWQKRVQVRKSVLNALLLLPQALRGALDESALSTNPIIFKSSLEEALKKFPAYLPEGVELPPEKAVGSLEEPFHIERVDQEQSVQLEKSNGVRSVELAQEKPVTTLEELKERIQKILTQGMKPEEREKVAQGALESVEKNGLPLDRPNGVYYFVWKVAHEKNPSAGGENFGKVQAPKDLDRLLEAIDRSINTPITCLQELRERVAEINRASFSAEQRENLSAALLASAEKNGIKLDKPNGVYYWVWFFSHQKDPRAGGDNFGKIHAPKNLPILLQAIEKAS